MEKTLDCLRDSCPFPAYVKCQLMQNERSKEEGNVWSFVLNIIFNKFLKFVSLDKQKMVAGLNWLI